jgi:hypothetical protein
LERDSVRKDGEIGRNKSRETRGKDDTENRRHGDTGTTQKEDTGMERRREENNNNRIGRQKKLEIMGADVL